MSDEKLQRAVERGTWRKTVGANVTAFTANTWDPALRRDERLLVPIDVRALVVPPAGGVTRVPTVTRAVDGAAEPWPRPPEPFQAAAARPAGVYVHFAIPDALTRGARQPAGAPPSDNALGLPPLPDRFVVVRLLHGGARRDAWVLEADRGVRTPLRDWREGMAHPAPGAGGPAVIPPAQLTAVAGGDLAWAATLDAVIDRFAIHDDLQDLPAASRGNAVLTYFVAGWWSRPDLDPMAGVTSLAEYSSRLQSLGWTAPALRSRSTKRRIAEEEGRATTGKLPGGYTKPGQVGKVGGVEVVSGKDLGIEGAGQASTLPIVPSLTLVHGVALGVRADGNGPDLRPGAAGLDVAFGPHPSAALAALLAGGAAADRESAERLITAFEMNLLATIDTPDGLAAVDEERHARGFVAMSGGARRDADRIGEGDPVGWPGQSDAVPTAAGVARSAEDAARGSGRKVKLDFMESRNGARRGERPLKWRIEELRSHGAIRAPRAYRNVSVPLPRYHYPADIALLVRGAARSPRHGGDGRFDAQGRLACRVPAGIIRGYSGVLDTDDLPLGLRALGSGALPPEVDLLLREVVLTDPYRVAELAAMASARRNLPVASVSQRLQAEAALRIFGASGDADVLAPQQADTLRRGSIAEGEDASPVASHLWSQPWVPLWCEWEVSLRVDEAREGWRLGVVDFERGIDIEPPAAPAEIHRGRTILTSASAKALAGDIRKWIVEEDQRDAAGQSQLTEDQEDVLEEGARAADAADLLAGAFEGIRDRLLGFDPVRARLERVAGPGRPALRPMPEAPPRLLAGGVAEVTRLRIVDAFGRHLDVPAARLAAAMIPATHRVPDLPAACLVPPRLQCPARLMVRLVDASAPDGVRAEESRVDQERPALARSPLAGFLLPDHVDEALEFFDAEGTPIGQLMHDPLTGSVLWEGAPGTPGPLGAPPQGGHPAIKHLARLAIGVVEADARARAGAAPPRESALAALLRVIDTTLWTADPFGATGTGAIAAIVGRPIAVVRAALWLDALADVDALDFAAPADREARRRAFEDLAARVIRVRLGEVTRSDDGLLACAVDDAYDRLHVISPDVRLRARESGPGEGHFRAFGEASRGAPPPRDIVHPYLDADAAIDLHPGQLVRLTLLMVPGLSVTATCGVLPRKRIALARDWFEKALERLSPSIRVGPVLFDATPEGVRMPKIAALGPRQRFTHKPDPLGWRDDVILAATQTAYLPDEPAGVREGWIRVSPIPPGEEGGS